MANNKFHVPALSAAISIATLSARPRADLEREVRSALFLLWRERATTVVS